MSWKATAYVKKLGIDRVTRGEKLLMFVLSDQYLDDRRQAFFRSLEDLALDALMSERQARRSLRSLERKGILAMVLLPGRKRSRIYSFPELEKADTLPGFSPQEPATTGTQTGHLEHPNRPQLWPVPAPPLRIPPMTKQTKQTTRVRALPLPGWIPKAAWRRYLEMRASMVNRPVTSGVIQQLIRKLDELRGDGNDPEAVLNQSVRGGYSELYPDHARQSNFRGGKNGNRSERLTTSGGLKGRAGKYANLKPHASG